MSAMPRALWLGLAGLVLGPLAWMVSIEIGEFAPTLFCRDGLRWGAGAVGLCLAVALAGAVLSWRGHAAGQGTLRFVAALLALPLILQLLATLVLSGCEA